MFRNALITSYIKISYSLLIDINLFWMFLYLHSKFEREITNVIANFLMGISTSHYVQTIAKYLPFYYFKIYILQTGSSK